MCRLMLPDMRNQAVVACARSKYRSSCGPPRRRIDRSSGSSRRRRHSRKPFNTGELRGPVTRSWTRESGGRELDSAYLEHGDLSIDAGRREVTVGDEEIQLAPKEFDLLWELLDHQGLVLNRDQLLERVWGYTFAGDTRTVDVHVRQLRRKLGDASPIVTVWGVGYKVSVEPKVARAS